MTSVTDSAGVTAAGEPGRGTPQAHDSAGGTAAQGKVTAVGDGTVIFNPAGSNYELQLRAPGYAGPVNVPVKGIIRVTARKIWSVPAGGNFITPIFGSPRIIQGRVRKIEAGQMVVQAACPVWVNLPDDDIVYDLANGTIRVGSFVNVTALPGGTFELSR